MKIKIDRTMLLVAGLIVVNKGVSYLREQGLARVFGANASFDAYAVAISVATILFSVVGNAMSAVVVPAIKEAELNGPEDRERAVAGSMALGLGLLAAVSVLQAALASPLVNLVAPGLTADGSSTATALLRLLAPTTAMMGYWVMAGGFLNAVQEFALPIYIPVFMDLVLLSAVLAFGHKFGIGAAAWGFLTGNVIQTAILTRALGRRRLLGRWSLAGAGFIKKLIKPAAPVMFTVLLSNGLLLLDKFYASGLAEGVISCLHYSALIISIPTGIFVIAVSTVVFPSLSELAASKDLKAARKKAAESILLSLSIGTASWIALWLFAAPAVKFLFGGGEFGSEAVSVTATIVKAQSFAIPALSITIIMERVFYSFNKTIYPLMGIIAGTVAFAASQALLESFAPWISGPMQIGLGYSAYAWVNLGVMALAYPRLYIPENQKAQGNCPIS